MKRRAGRALSWPKSLTIAGVSCRVNAFLQESTYPQQAVMRIYVRRAGVECCKAGRSPAIEVKLIGDITSPLGPHAGVPTKATKKKVRNKRRLYLQLRQPSIILASMHLTNSCPGELSPHLSTLWWYCCPV